MTNGLARMLLETALSTQKSAWAQVKSQDLENLARAYLVEEVPEIPCNHVYQLLRLYHGERGFQAKFFCTRCLLIQEKGV